MQSSVIGFPRVGKNRELKFASEKYFRKEISRDELLKTAASLRAEHLTYQKNAGISFFSSGDFSFYDGMLDTAVLLGVVPSRYSALGLLLCCSGLCPQDTARWGSMRSIPILRWREDIREMPETSVLSR